MIFFVALATYLHVNLVRKEPLSVAGGEVEEAAVFGVSGGRLQNLEVATDFGQDVRDEEIL